MSDSTMLWTILGVVATVVLGAWSLLYAIAGRRYPGRITFVQEGCIGLFDSIVRNFPEIVVAYQNKPVGQNLVLLKGAFLNTGTKDITREMVADKLTISLPNDYAWLTARTAGASPNVRAAISHSEDGTKLLFELGLFRCGEYLRFEALAEVPVSPEPEKETVSESLKAALSFEHRIADTKKIDSREISISPYRRKRLWLQIGLLGAQAAAAAFGLVMAFRYGNPMQEGDLRYWLSREHSTPILVTATPLTSGHLRLSGVHETFQSVVPVDEFFSSHKWKPTISRCFCGGANVLILSIMFLLPIGLAAAVLRSLLRESRLKNVLALSKIPGRSQPQHDLATVDNIEKSRDGEEPEELGTDRPFSRIQNLGSRSVDTRP